MVFGGVVFFSFPFFLSLGSGARFYVVGVLGRERNGGNRGGGLLFSQFRRIIPHWDGCWCTYYYYLFLAATQDCKQQEAGRVLCIERKGGGNTILLLSHPQSLGLFY